MVILGTSVVATAVTSLAPASGMISRIHAKPRRCLFTPLRVSGSPPAKALTPTRVTIGPSLADASVTTATPAASLDVAGLCKLDAVMENLLYNTVRTVATQSGMEFDLDNPNAAHYTWSNFAELFLHFPLSLSLDSYSPIPVTYGEVRLRPPPTASGGQAERPQAEATAVYFYDPIVPLYCSRGAGQSAHHAPPPP